MSPCRHASEGRFIATGGKLDFCNAFLSDFPDLERVSCGSVWQRQSNADWWREKRLSVKQLTQVVSNIWRLEVLLLEPLQWWKWNIHVACYLTLDWNEHCRAVHYNKNAEADKRLNVYPGQGRDECEMETHRVWGKHIFINTHINLQFRIADSLTCMVCGGENTNTRRTCWKRHLYWCVMWDGILVQGLALAEKRMKVSQ